MGDAWGQLWAERRVPSTAPGVLWVAIPPHCHVSVPLGHLPAPASNRVTGDTGRTGASWGGGCCSTTSLVSGTGSGRAALPFPTPRSPLSHPSLPPFAPRSAGEDLLAAGAAEGPHHPGPGAAEAEPGPAGPGTSWDPHWDALAEQDPHWGSVLFITLIPFLPRLLLILVAPCQVQGRFFGRIDSALQPLTVSLMSWGGVGVGWAQRAPPD